MFAAAEQKEGSERGLVGVSAKNPSHQLSTVYMWVPLEVLE